VCERKRDGVKRKRGGVGRDERWCLLDGKEDSSNCDIYTYKKEGGKKEGELR
tara:strand:+ start:225 stop:380 length:156 start_codon:yes stop_codon:yes gene_type:complete